MPSQKELWDELTEIAIENPRYEREAYLFVLNGLNWAFSQMGEKRHLTGEEFTEFLVAFAREEFGELADCVLNEWGVYQTRDFGEIVYKLIESGKMTKEPEDSISDFDDVLDLDRALNDPDFVPRPLK
ncbi:MAG: Minf_1886 family protein [bacterium]